MENKITLKEWLLIKPYKKEVDSDKYYIEVANKIKKEFSNFTIEETEELEESIEFFSIFIVSYLEDIISNLNIFNTFTKLHYKMYGKKLPFFDSAQNIEGEINFSDIQFLLWYFMNVDDTDNFYNPFFFNTDKFLEFIEIIYNILKKASKSLPPNTYLQNYYSLQKNEHDFFEIRDLMERFYFDNYLFYFDIFPIFQEKIDKVIFETKDRMDEATINSLIFSERLRILFSQPSRLLAIKASEWLAEYLGENHSEYSELKKLNDTIRGYFLFKGMDEKYCYFEQLELKKEFKVAKNSIKINQIKLKKSHVYVIEIIKWKDEWMQCGILMYIGPFKKAKQLKTRFIDILKIKFMDKKFKKKQIAYLKKQYKMFLDFTKGSQIVFLESNKVKDFIEKLNRYFFKHGNKKNLFESKDFSYIDEPGLLFFNPQKGIEIEFGLNSAFPCPENPFYKKEESSEAVAILLFNSEPSLELARYCVNNFKDKLTFFTEEDGKDLLDDIDFVLRFNKREKFYEFPYMIYLN